MARYLHVEVKAVQRSKQSGGPCGDVVHVERTARATTVIVADGIGSGIKANLAATVTVSRLVELLASGFSLRDAFAAVAHTNQQAMGSELPFVAFSVARIMPDGRTTVLSFEAPPAILVGRHMCRVLDHRRLNLEQAVTYEANCQLDEGEGLVIVSDGVTQAGLGQGLPYGWGIDEVGKYVNRLLGSGMKRVQLADALLAEAAGLWGRKVGDDCSVALADCRIGEVVTVFTGPPADRSRDQAVVHEFMQRHGRKVVCGATTAKVVQRGIGGQLSVDQKGHSLIAPPRYELPGVDLATEGAVTLNHVYNIWDAEERMLEPDTGPTLLRDMLKMADRVDIVCGRAPNVGGLDIAFCQQGIIGRTRIVELLADRLREDGKLVTIGYV